MKIPMRTNIDIDDELMAATMKYSGKPTKKAAVEEAMRQYNRSMIMRDIIESTRGIGWDDGRIEEQRRLHAAGDGSSFDHDQ